MSDRNEYKGYERRQDPIDSAVIREFFSKLDAHTEEERAKFKEITDELAKINVMLANAARLANAASKAFPKNSDGEPDFAGHRAAHEAEIKAAEAKERFWTSVSAEVVGKGILQAVIIILGLAGLGMLAKWKGIF